jgi:hypothetical protein
MSKRRPSSQIAKTPSSHGRQDFTHVPPAPARPAVPPGGVPDLQLPGLWGRRTALGVAVAVIFATLLIGLGWFNRAALLSAFGSNSGAPLDVDADWSKAPVNEDERVAAEFVQLKNAGDPSAAGLLGRTPASPPDAVSRAEADRLQTDFFLRQDLHIVGARRGRSPGTLVLATKGNVSAPGLLVQEGAAASSEQRTMSNPDLTVEVRDGKIFGVRCDLGH